MMVDVEVLAALIRRGNKALVALTEEAQRDAEAAETAFEQKYQRLLQFEPNVLKCFGSSSVKLNVGGTYFSTSVESLTKEPDTFFSAMFSGRWEVVSLRHANSAVKLL